MSLRLTQYKVHEKINLIENRVQLRNTIYVDVLNRQTIYVLVTRQKCYV